RQGDPLGSWLHDLSLADDLELVAAMNPAVEVWALHDDVRFMGPIELLPKAFDDWVKISSKANTVVQPAKSRLITWHPEHVTEPIKAWMHANRVKLETNAAVVAGGIVARTAST